MGHTHVVGGECASLRRCRKYNTTDIRTTFWFVYRAGPVGTKAPLAGTTNPPVDVTVRREF